MPAPAPAQEIQPAPRPLTFKSGVTGGPVGSQAVFIIFQHELGQFVGFVPPDFADYIARTLVDQAQKARRGGLIIPAPVLPKDFDPRGNGDRGGH